jgi:hypothetical protein
VLSTPDLEERVLCYLEEECGTSARKFTPAERVSQNTFVQMLHEWLSTILSRLKALLLLTVLEELLSPNGFLKNH